MQERLQQARQQVEVRLRTALSQLNITDDRLSRAMQYGLLNGGKRLRPFLAYATSEALGGSWTDADAAAVSLEMVHSYSLIHDDLPAMDDDDLRRGQPTCHKAFDEATAILAGDGLLTAAFELLSQAPLGAVQRLKLISLLAKASGSAGMVAGQSMDLGHVGRRISVAELESMHRHKTGALICAAVEMGAFSVHAQLDEHLHQALVTYARAIGLAFQIQDDILDIEGDTRTLGKMPGADSALDKPTYPELLGLDNAKHKACELVQEAQEALNVLPGHYQLLSDIASYVVERDH